MRIRSPFRLAGPVIAGDGHDLDVVAGERRVVPWERPSLDVVAERVVDGYPWYTIARVGSEFVCRFPGLADFVISADLGTVTCHPAETTDDGLVPIMVAGTVAAFVLSQAGSCVLHASAVELAGGALAFVGVSGQGKTTMATAFCAAGAGLVADDLLPIEVDGERSGGDDRVWCRATAHELRLRPKAASLIERFDEEVIRALTSDERHAIAPQASKASRLPLWGIVLPFPDHDHDTTSSRRLPAGEAALRLATCQRVEGWTDREHLRSQFSTILALIERVSVFEVRVPWGPPFAPDLAAQVLGSCGLTDRFGFAAALSG
ncbi:MAG: hypothetical protein M3137_07615 [Actinomycetota bacterium]|nr:hypothetical protein [Actinomycetota bacterium]